MGRQTRPIPVRVDMVLGESVNVERIDGHEPNTWVAEQDIFWLIPGRERGSLT